jgi:hypothetical protein
LIYASNAKKKSTVTVLLKTFVFFITVNKKNSIASNRKWLHPRKIFFFLSQKKYLYYAELHVQIQFTNYLVNPINKEVLEIILNTHMILILVVGFVTYKKCEISKKFIQPN